MLNKRYYYNLSIAICQKDKDYIESLKSGKFGKKSKAGILSYIIKYYKDKHK